jgi:hypothetical protein
VGVCSLTLVLEHGAGDGRGVVVSVRSYGWGGKETP